MNLTKIPWVKNPDGTQGYTWNPITGCLNHRDGKCLGGNFPCYAYKLAHGRLKQRYLTGGELSLQDCVYAPRRQDPFYPRFWEDRLDDPILTDRNICIKRHTRGQRRTPRGIFVCDMGELFGDWTPRKWQEEIFLTITCNPQHRFYLLTKQPQNLPVWSPFSPNCFVGVTVTGVETLQQRNAMLALQKVQAKVKFLSIEPLLSEIIFDVSELTKCGVNWLIIGSQTQPTRHPPREWVEEIISAADKAHIPVFVKEPLAKHLNIYREEMPDAKEKD